MRCRNNALAGPFGGCFAVQQVDTTASKNTPANINTAASLKNVLKQVEIDKADLPVAIAANQAAGTDEALQNAAAVSSLLNISITSLEAPTQTLDVALGGNAATATSAAAEATATGTTDNNNNNNGNNRNGNGNSRFGNGFGRGNNNRRRAMTFFA